jgi:PAS domain S-box-containing protein
VDSARNEPVDSRRVLAAVQRIQAEFLATRDPRELHGEWLARLMALTGSECGFSAEVRFDARGMAEMSVLAIAPAADAAGSSEPPAKVAKSGLVFETPDAWIREALRSSAASLVNGPESAELAARTPLANMGVKALLALPIQRAGEVQGLVVLGKRRAGFNARSGSSLAALATTCASLIEAQRAQRTRTEQQRATQQLAHERAVLERLARMDPLEEVLEALVLGHEALYPGTLGSVLLLDQHGRRLLSGAAPSLPLEYTRATHGVEIGPSVGSCGTAAYLRESVIVTDIASDPRWARARDFALSFSLRACWSSPILSGQGEVLGTFALYYREPRAPEQHELIAIESSARIAGLAIERKRQEAELRASAERLALASKSAQMGIFDYDIEHGRLMWDEQMLSIYGVRREDFGGGYPSWRERVHPDDLEAAEASVNDSIAGLHPFQASFRIIRPDGKTRFIEAATVMQRDASGRATRMTGVNIDVTAKKQLEAQLLRSQRLESVGRLAGGLAHDLNNLLAPMLIGPSMLRDSVQSQEGRSLLDTIESSAQRAASVIRQLLTFSRGTEGARAPVDCSAIIEDMLHIIRETFPRNITARRSNLASSTTVLGDSTQLHQVLMNLCVNARDEMPEGGTLDLRLENVEVDARLARMYPWSQPGRFVMISVSDDGRGIDPEHMDKLFEPFFTTKGVGFGTGLGLATVLGIVKNHGGFVQVQSQLGRGSEFKVFLPASSADIVQESAQDRDQFPRGHGELVLVVDDEESIRRVTRAMLERSGYRVLLATSGEEALTLHRENHGQVNLILSDLVMPGMDGDSLIRAIRAVDRSVRLIVMSGDVGAQGHQSPIARMVDGLLEKPFTMEAILRSLHAALADRGAKVAARS